MNVVEVRGAYKYYGNKRDSNIVLNNVDLTVKFGSIYGLLGPSGSGKTTLLECTLGIKSLNAGSAKIFNQNAKSICPQRIGYMPQEVALVDVFSIKETNFYFGQIRGMKKEEIEERHKFLTNLFELNDENKLIRELSGGQKRSVSFAVTILHQPELLILDEPTVGLDPLLRERMWCYLRELTDQYQTTIIITTHYIEEAKSSDYIGLIREGSLVEDSLPNLLNRFRTNSLEEAFLKLCLQQKETNERTIVNRQSIESPPGISKSTNEPETTASKFTPNYLDRIKALLKKDYLVAVREPIKFFIFFCFPIMTLVSLFFAVGGNPKGLKLGIITEEVENIEDCFNNSLITTKVEDYECILNKISCRFIKEVEESLGETLYYQSFEDAFKDAKSAKIFGIVYFKQNFTGSVTEVRDIGADSDDGSFDNSKIIVYLDESDYQLTAFMKKTLQASYKNFSEGLMADCGYPKNLANAPLKFEDPIFGTADEDFRAYIIPGMCVSILNFVAIIVTSTVFITDRLDGIWTRSLLAGVKPWEIMVAHILIQSLVVLIQCVEITILVALMLSNIHFGNALTFCSLLILQSFSGMTLGILISISLNSYSLANFASVAFFYPLLLVCGIFWPIEGLPMILRNISYFLPFTLPAIAVRNILVKNWTLLHLPVFIACGITVFWIATFITLSLIVLRIRK